MLLELPPTQTIDLDGPVVYRSWAGPSDTTFVLVHGLGGSHLNWLQVAEGLSGLGRVVALDLPGFGRSPAAGRGTRVMDLRRSLARFIDEAASGRVVVVGNSMGGLIASVEAAVEPDRVTGLVLSASVFPWTRGSLPHPAVLAAFSLYGLDGVGERLVRARRRSMSPEAFVRVGLRLLTPDPGVIPEEVDPAAGRARARDAGRSRTAEELHRGGTVDRDLHPNALPGDQDDGRGSGARSS